MSTVVLNEQLLACRVCENSVYNIITSLVLATTAEHALKCQ